jgi:hypothetical protein
VAAAAVLLMVAFLLFQLQEARLALVAEASVWLTGVMAPSTLIPYLRSLPSLLFPRSLLFRPGKNPRL